MPSARVTPSRTVLPPDAARYVAPGDPTALADGIRWVAEHADEAARMAERARDAASAFTYSARAEAIADFCRYIVGAQR